MERWLRPVPFRRSKDDGPALTIQIAYEALVALDAEVITLHPDDYDWLIAQASGDEQGEAEIRGWLRFGALRLVCGPRPTPRRPMFDHSSRRLFTEAPPPPTQEEEDP